MSRLHQLARAFSLSVIFQASLYALTPSSVTLIASPMPSNYGQAVTLTATVNAGATGKVTFYDGVNVLGIATISGTQASMTTVMLPSGNRSLHAHYSGDATYAPSNSAAAAQTVLAGTSLGFRKDVNIPRSDYITGMAVADFDGDTKQDYVLANGSSTTVTVFLGNGDGTFHPGVDYTLGFYANSILAGDFNGDGMADLVVVTTGNQVLTLLGNGDGTFQSPVSSPAGQSPVNATLGDFNGDGKLDLAIGYTSGTNLAILTGLGNGTFAAPVTVPVGMPPTYVIAADFNGDGASDLAVGNANYSNVNVVLGNGDGTFQAAKNTNTPYSTLNSFTSADFNGDGKPDLALLRSYNIMVLLGNGDGTFSAAPVIGGYYGSIVVEDFDGDGKPDIAQVNTMGSYPPAANALLFWGGNGDGTFRSPVQFPVSKSGMNVAATGDFNGDGKVDLLLGSRSYTVGVSMVAGGAIPDLSIAVSHGGGFTQGQLGASYTVTVRNDGDIVSVGPVGVVVSLAAGLTATAASGSGWACDTATLACTRTDALVPGTAFPAITIRLNVAGGVTGNLTSNFVASGGGDQNLANNYASDTTLARASTTSSLTSSPNASTLSQPVTLTAVVSGSVTGSVTFYDGTVILGSAPISSGQATLTTSQLASGVRYLRALYRGDSNYGPSTSAVRTQTVNTLSANGTQPWTSYKVNNYPAGIVKDDFNGDGKSDLVVLSGGNSASSIGILLGNGNGTFQAAVNYPVTSNDYGANTLIAGDFNNDGKLDVVVSVNSGIYLIGGNGDGTFRAAQSISTSSIYWLGAADFDGDGNADLSTRNNNGVAQLWLGNGDGTFQSPITITPNGTSVSAVAIADMNVDGKPDVLYYSGSTLTVLLGNGDGTFRQSGSGVLSNNGTPVWVVADFNGDGKPDIVASSYSALTVVLGNGDGTLRAPVQSSLNMTTGSFALAGDFNGDGRMDVVFSGYYSGQFVLVPGNGDGTFQPTIGVACEGNSQTLVAGDFNGDGRADLAAAISNSSTVDVFLSGLFSGLNITVSHSGRFTAGGTGIYQVVVENPAFASTSGVVSVTVGLPAGLTATSISGNYYWNCTLVTLICTTSNSLGSNNSYPAITVTAKVASNLLPSIITTQASVTNSGIVRATSDPTTIVLPSTVSLAASPSPATVGQSVALTATVTPGSTGFVSFSDGGMALGTASISNGSASMTTRLLSSGLRPLIASYAGDSTHAPSWSAPTNLQIKTSAASGFATAVTFPTGAGPWAVAYGDFNLDGKTDLVTANSTGNTVSVLLGVGDGSFGTNSDYAAGTKPVSVVVADFNNDGKPDIAVANQTSNDVSILIGNGNGTFQPAVSVPTVTQPAFLLVSDFDADGFTDILVFGGNYNGASLLFGVGNGTFRPSVVSLGSANFATIGDFNQDSKFDILGGPYNYLYLGNGDGTFQNANSSNTPYGNSIAVGDLNSDGKTDFVTGYSNGVAVTLGKGDGTFQPYTTSTTSFNPATVLTADVNGDGKLDVVSVANSNLAVLLGNGDGTLQSSVSYSVSSSARTAIAADFNGDGRIDLAVPNSGTSGISIYLGVLTPILSVTSSHTGTFALGQTDASYTLLLTNRGPGDTSGTVTLSDSLPSGFTATAMVGAGWSCAVATVSCTRNEVLAAGASYPPVVVTVTIAGNAPASVINIVNASGGGAIPSTGVDPTTISAPSTIIQTTPAGLQFSVDGGAVQVAPQTMSLSPGAHTISVTATQGGAAGTRYAFTGWSDSGAVAHTITVGITPTTYMATFKTQYLLTVSSIPAPGGSVSPASGVYYDSGTGVSLTATPNAPYVLTSWSGDASGTANPLGLTMSAPRSVTANFNVPGFTCDITGDGSTNVADVQTIINEALGVTPATHDLNRDGVVNVADVQKLINAALGLGCIY